MKTALGLMLAVGALMGCDVEDPVWKLDAAADVPGDIQDDVAPDAPDAGLDIADDRDPGWGEDAVSDSKDTGMDVPGDEGAWDIADDAGDSGPGDTIQDHAQDGKEVTDDGGEDAALDVADAGDCGPVVCMECVCECADGSKKKYGGCFDDCDEAPPGYKDCTADCNVICVDATGQECWGEGSQGSCPDGYICVAPPCEMCGMPPAPVCVPEPCPVDGCYLDQHCGDGEKCYGASFTDGKAGQCLFEPDPPGCWEDSECPPSASCEGGSHCPPCVPCLIPLMPGKCLPLEGQEGVVLWVRQSYVLSGSKVAPVWYNLTDEAIFLPGCATYYIEKWDQDNEEWLYVGPPLECFWEGLAQEIGPYGALEAFDYATSPDDTAQFRLHGEYWTGCKPNEPISQAECQGGPFEVYSNQFFVGPPPP